MELDELQTEFPALFGDLLEAPCAWRGQPRQMEQSPRAELDVIAIAAIGVDEEAWSASDDDVAATVHGARELTLQVTMWSPVQTLQTSARAFLERLRTRLRFPSTRDALLALGMGIVSIEDTVILDQIEDGRRVSIAALDVRLAYGTSETDDSIPWIERFALHHGDSTVEVELD